MLLPVAPHPRRSLRLDSHEEVRVIKGSSDIRQAADAEGKYPHLFLMNLEDPSARIVAVSR